MGNNCLGELGLVEKTVYFLTNIATNLKKAKHSFVDTCITHCPKPVRFKNSQQKVLPFLFEDFLLFSDRVESRDKIYIIEIHQVERNHQCM